MRLLAVALVAALSVASASQTLLSEPAARIAGAAELALAAGTGHGSAAAHI